MSGCIRDLSIWHSPVFLLNSCLAELREELEYYKNRKLSGRQKHNAKWMAIYNDFVAGYESGMTMIEIAKRNNVSKRTIYRYKAYYDKITQTEL